MSPSDWLVWFNHKHLPTQPWGGRQDPASHAAHTRGLNHQHCSVFVVHAAAGRTPKLWHLQWGGCYNCYRPHVRCWPELRSTNATFPRGREWSVECGYQVQHLPPEFRSVSPMIVQGYWWEHQTGHIQFSTSSEFLYTATALPSPYRCCCVTLTSVWRHANARDTVIQCYAPVRRAWVAWSQPTNSGDIILYSGLLRPGQEIQAQPRVHDGTKPL